VEALWLAAAPYRSLAAGWRTGRLLGRDCHPDYDATRAFQRAQFRVINSAEARAARAAAPPPKVSGAATTSAALVARGRYCQAESVRAIMPRASCTTGSSTPVLSGHHVRRTTAPPMAITVAGRDSWMHTGARNPSGLSRLRSGRAAAEHTDRAACAIHRTRTFLRMANAQPSYPSAR
jgi:hypothetical protein